MIAHQHTDISPPELVSFHWLAISNENNFYQKYWCRCIKTGENEKAGKVWV